MANLLDLPLELILHILSYIPRYEPYGRSLEPHPHPLLAFCSMSKYLKSVAQPVLFTRFSNYSSPRSLVYFAHAIARRPSLGLHVRSISVDIPYRDSMGDLDHPIADMAEDFRRAITRLELPEDRLHAWVQGITTLQVSTLAAFVISQTPNLSTLSIRAHTIDVDQHRELATPSVMDELLFTLGPRVGEFEGGPSRLRRYAPNLKRLYITHSGGSSRLSIQAYASLLSCEGLESFRGATMSIMQDDDTPSNIKPDSLPLSRLSLDYREINKKGIEMILSACKALRSLTLLGSYSFDEDLPSSLESALNRHRSSLEELKFSFGSDYHYKDPNLGLPKFNDLKPFTRLRQLEIDEKAMVIDRECLPPSLERYIIQNAKQTILLNVSQLAGSTKTASNPALEVVLHVHSSFRTSYLTFWAMNDDLDVARQRLVEVLRGTRISLVTKTARRMKRSGLSIDEILFVDEHGFRHESKFPPPRAKRLY